MMSRLQSLVLSATLLMAVNSAGYARAAPPLAPSLASHRAIYDLSLTRAAQSEGVRSAQGTMIYSITDRCDGYTVESNLQMELAFASGIDNQIDQRYAAWEAKDGRSASFRMQVLENGSLSKSYRGNVALEADGSGAVTYETDSIQTFKLPKGTLLSTGHTLALLKAAAAGEKFFVRPVIDGSFEEGPFMISAVIAPARGGAAKPGDLATGPAWPVGLAYFAFGTDNEAPSYELNMSILPNGVSRSLSQDFGKFTLGFDLVRAEPVVPPPC
ncbi:MAG: EipB family protein [Rhodospirillaceae bacterium]